MSRVSSCHVVIYSAVYFKTNRSPEKHCKVKYLKPTVVKLQRLFL